jgi:hypothetical protein
VYWWKLFLAHYNGVSVMMLDEWSCPDEIFQSDSCLSGCGGLSCQGFFHTQFPQFILQQNLHINALELLAIIVCIKVWSHHWSGKRILVNCDNLVAVEVINAGRTRNRFLQACLREIVWWAAKHEFELRARHIAGNCNRAADALSRWHLHQKFQDQFNFDFKGSGLIEVNILPDVFTFTHSW